MNSRSTRHDLGKRESADDVMVQERAVPLPATADLEEFEKFFREQFSPAAPAAGNEPAAPVLAADPLMAELARIVGQDVRPMASHAPRLPTAHDPFAPDESGFRPSLTESPEQDPFVAFEDELRRFDAEHKARQSVQSEIAAGEATLQIARPDVASRQIEASLDHIEPRRDEFVDTLRGPVTDAAGMQPLPPLEAPEVMASGLEEENPRSRKVMILLGLAGAVALAGVVGVLGFKGRAKTPREVPVITAKTTPAKEKPADPGGVEISGQDRQVLARRSEEPKGPTNVVNKDEQPVDLNQTPKREAARVILPPTSAQSQAPAAPNPPVPILMPSASQPTAPPAVAAPAQPAPGTGLEPRRVRSVRITGEGESAPAAPTQPSPQAVPGVPRAPALASAPPPAAALVPAPAAPVASPKSEARPVSTARAATPPSATPQTARAPAPVRPAQAPQPAAAADDGAAPLSLRPPAGSAAAPARTAAAPSAGGSGSFAVQMQATPSEAEARSAAAQLKQRHAGVLSSYTPAVRQATVNDRTVYRVRIGGLSRESAASLCARLKADGGSCFVAAN